MWLLWQAANLHVDVMISVSQRAVSVPPTAPTLVGCTYSTQAASLYNFRTSLCCSKSCFDLFLDKAVAASYKAEHACTKSLLLKEQKWHLERGVTVLFWVIITNVMVNQVTWPSRLALQAWTWYKLSSHMSYFHSAEEAKQVARLQPSKTATLETMVSVSLTPFWLSVPLQLPVPPACGLIHSKVI